MKHIVILGAGFGGISTAKNLLPKLPRDYKIFLIDKNSYQTFHAALYEIATAHVEKKYPRKADYQELYNPATLGIERIFPKRKSFQFIKARVKDINLREKKVFLENGEPLPFDYLVLALGSETNFYGIEGLEEKALPLREVQEAMNIRNSIQEIFERKAADQQIDILIGGGGFSGCEFATELIFYVRKLAKKFGRQGKFTKVTVVEASNSLLPGADEWVKKVVKERMEKLGIKILFEKPISRVQNSTLSLKTGEQLPFDLLIWTAGVKANSLLERIDGVKLEKGCRVLSDDCLRIIPYNYVFGVGDNLYCFDPVIQTPFPATAWAAIEQGKIAARNILNQIQEKKLIECPSLKSKLAIPLGGKWAVFHFGPLKFRGPFGWLMKELITFRYYLKVLPPFHAFLLWMKEFQLYTKND